MNREEKLSFGLVYHTNEESREFLVLHEACPHKWRTCFCIPKKWVLVKRKVSLRSLRSLFGWGHLFLIFVACGKFCKWSKLEFYIFAKVFTICVIRWYRRFFFKALSNEEIAPHSIAEFCNLQDRNIFRPLLRSVNQVNRSCIGVEKYGPSAFKRRVARLFSSPGCKDPSYLMKRFLTYI